MITLAWFWFLLSVAALTWSVFLLRLLSIAQHDVARWRRRAELAHREADRLAGRSIGGGW